MGFYSDFAKIRSSGVHCFELAALDAVPVVKQAAHVFPDGIQVPVAFLATPSEEEQEAVFQFEVTPYGSRAGAVEAIKAEALKSAIEFTETAIKKAFPGKERDVLKALEDLEKEGELVKSGDTWSKP